MSDSLPILETGTVVPSSPIRIENDPGSAIASLSGPLASVAQNNGKDIHLYYIDQSSILRDIYSTNYGVSWIRGKLGEKKVKPVSGSGVAAITYSAREPAIECIHVFYQLEERETHVIKELIYNGTTWGDGELACDLAIAGTKLTAVTPRIGNHNEIYLYYQYPPSFNMASYDGRKWDY